jgi:hypothetical protein
MFYELASEQEVVLWKLELLSRSQQECYVTFLANKFFHSATNLENNEGRHEWLQESETSF